MQGEYRVISDENIPIKVDELFGNEGFDVKRVPLGISDDKISKIAKLENRIILTFDKHFLNKKKFPPEEHYGIVFVSIIPPLIDTVFFSLMKLFKEYSSLDLKGKLIVVTAFGNREK
jgi:hypothetical protein|tara:strand:- start:13 stop:363 length:351 start_codon:yes stop_codon:yes gene_type:complete